MNPSRVPDRRLRKRLAAVITADRLADQPRLVDALRRWHDHAIRVVHQIRPGDDPHTWQYNCHAFTFGLQEWAGFLPLADAGVWADGAFVAALLPSLQECSSAEAADGDLVVYATDVQIVHSGVVQGDRVVSKWGVGHLWEHRPFEMPLYFGWIDRYFRRPARDVAVAGFQAYAGAATRRRTD